MPVPAAASYVRLSSLTGPRRSQVSLETLTSGKLGAQFASSASTSIFGTDGDSPTEQSSHVATFRKTTDLHPPQRTAVMPRPSWKGFLRLSLVSVPVEAINAVSSEDDGVALHQLHANAIAAFATRNSARFMAK